MFEIEFYKLSNGKIPVEIFLDELSPKLRVKAVDTLEILEEFGTNLREPYSKHIENGIFELRIKFARDVLRIFYFFYIDEKIVITNGFIKKTRKTPAREIKLAKQYKQDYERRNSNE